MPQIRHIFFAFMATLAPGAWAQEAVSAVREEHRYQFALHSSITDYQEKVMVQQITGLEPEMRVNIDREAHVMKILAYQAIDPQEVIDLAAQNGIAIGHRRRLAEAPGNTNPNE